LAFVFNSPSFELRLYSLRAGNNAPHTMDAMPATNNHAMRQTRRHDAATCAGHWTTHKHYGRHTARERFAAGAGAGSGMLVLLSITMPCVSQIDHQAADRSPRFRWIITCVSERGVWVCVGGGRVDGRRPAGGVWGALHGSPARWPARKPGVASIARLGLA